MKFRFRDLTEAQLLALAITAEEEDGHIYRDFAESLRKDYPATADLFTRMAEEEAGHHQRLLDVYRERFGEHIPLIRRHDVKGFMLHRPSWLTRSLGPARVREQVALMEQEARRFYQSAAERATDASVRKLLNDLASEEEKHEELAAGVTAEQKADGRLEREDIAARRLFVLRYAQPGLAGLMDGSVSTLAPLFAAAFATANTAETFKVGLAASLGAGISMGFAEALSDDGKLSGRGTPWLRGTICGVMTALGGLGHTMPYLLGDFHLATSVAVVVVGFELGIISWIRKRYMDTPLLSAIFQVVVGGVLVFITGILIGKS